MPAVEVSMRLCFHAMAVPLEPRSLPLIDPLDLTAEGDRDDVQVSLVSFKQSADMAWLVTGLEVRVRWWQTNMHAIAILQEIRAALKNLRPASGAKRLLPRYSTSLVALKIREHIIWVMNEPRSVTLALPAGSEQQELLWFLDEMQKDVENILDGDPEEDKPVKQDVPAEEATWAQQARDKIQEHALVNKVHYLPSRRAFKVILQSKEALEFRMKDYKKSPQDAFERVALTALADLDTRAQSGPSSSSQQPPAAAVEEDAVEDLANQA